MGKKKPLIQIYETSDALTQEMIFGLLSKIEALRVQATRNGRDTFIVVECSGDDEAWPVHQCVTSIDPGAVLAHTSVKQLDPLLPTRRC